MIARSQRDAYTSDMTIKAPAVKKLKPLTTLYALYDAKGEYCGTYETEEDASDDCYGPRFRPKSTIVEYVRSKNRAKVVKSGG